MNTIIIAIFTIMFFIPGLLLGLISVVIINVVIAYTGTDYFDCWLIERDYCYEEGGEFYICLLYTSPSPRDLSTSRMPSSA